MPSLRLCERGHSAVHYYEIMLDLKVIDKIVGKHTKTHQKSFMSNIIRSTSSRKIVFDT